MSPSAWINELKTLLDAGASYVITEGRDSGTAGLYRPSGELREGLVEEIGQNLDLGRVVFETPTAKAQMHMIKRFGPEVNLGNIRPQDVLLLETQRRGLRSETFWI
jgi:phosphosulfolactate synthase